MNEINRLTKEMIAFYGKRQKDVRSIMTGKSINFI